MPDVLENVREAVAERADLPGMSLMEHLTELRTRLIHSVVALLIAFCVAYIWHERLFNIVQAPMDNLHYDLNITHPTDGLNIYLKTALYGGGILAAPYILYQLWLFISPGMYKHEKRFVLPFMAATVALFFCGAYFGYHWVLPSALHMLIGDFGKRFHAIITIDEYTGFFTSIIFGLGITFELPILIFFLAVFGIVDGKFLIRHMRYAVLIIFVIASVICPLPDPLSMCLFALPMLVLYAISVLIAFLVHPARRNKNKPKPATT
jgi:sec-independent protein translocase protein TatC